MNLVDWSLAVEAGLHRPPLLRMNGKRPLDDEWPTGPFDEPDRWRRRLRFHTGNVGVATGRGLGVLDVDRYKEGAEDALEALAEKFGLTTDTVTVETGRGGLHLYYSYPAGLYLPSVPLGFRGYPGIELKADGGCVVFPPSVHPDTGQEYLFLYDCGFDETETVEFPSSFLEFAGARPGGDRRTGSRRWHPLSDEEIAQLDPRDVEAVRLLVEHFGGHDPIRTHTGTIGIYRPGKNDGSTSITVGHRGPGEAWCWSDNWPPFTQNQGYSLGQLKEMAGIAPRIVVPDAPLELPYGYRLWQPGDDLTPPPALAQAAYHGPVGDYLHLVEGETEGHPAAIGAGLLARLGCRIGRRAQIWNGEHFHHPNLFNLTVGKTSTGAKGVADNTVQLFIDQIDPAFVVKHIVGGFGSGEALLDDIRDVGDGEEPVEKRRIIVEAEFARILQVARREHNILSIIIRNAFDYAPIRHRTKAHGRIVATGHHVSVDAAITPEELLTLTAELDLKNGWLNRFMFFHSRLAATLPFGGRIDRVGLGKIADTVTAAFDWLENTPAVNGVHRLYQVLEDVDTTPATLRDLAQVYDPWYRAIREGSPPLPELTCRQHVHVPRLMLILAVMDRAPAVTVDHFRAAKAWNDYSVATAIGVFGTVGPPGRAGQLLAAIRDAGAAGLDGTGQRKVFHDHLSGEDMAALRAELEDQRLIFTTTFATGGRNRMVSYAICGDRR